MTARPRLLVLLVSAALLGASAIPPSAGAIEAVKRPKLGRSFVVSLVSGTVTVKKPGRARASRLSRRRTVIPVGSTVNATKGKVRLVGAVRRSGGSQAGVFYAGAFRATQARRDRAVIDLKLVGGNFSGCAASASAKGYVSVSKRVRRLYGNAKGNFRTRGGHSAATVRGTKWLTEDRCDSTRVAAEEGSVTVDTGGSQSEVQEGTVFESTFTTDPQPVPGYADFYIASINYELPGGGSRVGENGPLGFVGFLLGINMFKDQHADFGEVCIRRVDGGAERCTQYPFEPNPYDTDCTDPGQLDCLYGAGDQCDPESGPGDYYVRFRVNGVDLPFTLTAQAPEPDPYWLEVYRQPGSWCLNRKEQSAFP